MKKMNNFKNIIEEESQKEYYMKLHDFVENEYEDIRNFFRGLF